MLQFLCRVKFHSIDLEMIALNSVDKLHINTHHRLCKPVHLTSNRVVWGLDNKLKPLFVVRPWYQSVHHVVVTQTWGGGSATLLELLIPPYCAVSDDLQTLEPPNSPSCPHLYTHTCPHLILTPSLPSLPASYQSWRTNGVTSWLFCMNICNCSQVLLVANQLAALHLYIYFGLYYYTLIQDIGCELQPLNLLLNLCWIMLVCVTFPLPGWDFLPSFRECSVVCPFLGTLARMSIFLPYPVLCRLVGP